MSIFIPSSSQRSFRADQWRLATAALFGSICAFLVMPLLGIFLVVLVAAYSTSRAALFFLCAFVIIFFTILNVAKVPESDLVQYLNLYQLSQDIGLLEFMFSDSLRSYGAKEPFFRLFIKVVSVGFGGSESAFIAVSTALPYIILTVAMLRLSRHFGVPNSLTTFLLFVLLMNPLMFSISAHLIRQNLAFALFFLAFANLITNKKGYWKWAVVGVLMHSMTLLLVPFFFLRGLRSELSPRLFVTALIFPVLILVGISLLPKILSLIAGLPSVLVYPLQRFAQEIFSPTLDGSTGLPPLLRHAPLVTSISVFFLFNRHSGIVFNPLFVNIFLYLSLIIFFGDITPLLQYRVFYVAVATFPFIILSIASWQYWAPFAIFLIVPIYILTFIYYFLNSHWDYGYVKDISDIIFLFFSGA